MQLFQFHIDINKSDQELREFLHHRKRNESDEICFQDIAPEKFTICQGNGSKTGYLKARCRHYQTPKNILKLKFFLVPLYRNAFFIFTGVYLFLMTNAMYFNWGTTYFNLQIEILTGVYAFIFLVWFIFTRREIKRFKRQITAFFQNNQL